jgi:hypothetical protein
MAAIVRQSSLTSLDPLKANFKNFMFKCWMTWFQQPPQPIMYDFGDRLQHGPDKDVLMGYRGMSKSYITVTYGAWTHHCDPEALILALAASGNAASGNAFLYWGMINKFPWLSHLKPSGILRYSATAFDVQGSKLEKSESFASMSVFSGDKTGRRADLIIPDDVETPNTSSTEGERTELRKHYAELGSAILRTDRLGKVKVLGTPQTEATIYTELAMDKGYGMRIYPVLYPKPEEMTHYGPWLDPKIRKALEDNPLLAGTSTTPARFSEADIQARLLEWGLTEFNRQFKLWTDVGEATERPLKLRDCPIINVPVPTLQEPLKVPSELRWDPSPINLVPGLQVDALNGDSLVYYPADTKEYREYWQKPEGIIIQVDPSGGGMDETTWGAIAQHNGRVFLLDMEGAIEGFSTPTLEGIAAMAKRWGAQRIRIEKNYGGGMFTALLRPALLKANHPCAIEEEFATGQKEVRMVDSLEALVSLHRLVFNRTVLQKDFPVRYAQVADAKQRFYRLTYQFTRVTKMKGALAHDDRLDMLASGARSFLGSLSRQLDEAAAESRAMEINKDVDYLIEQQRLEREALGIYDGGRPSNGFRIGEAVGRDTGGLAGSPLFPGRGKP